MSNLLGLDVGTKRVGVAAADSSVPIAMPLLTLDVDGTEIDRVKQLVKEREVKTVVVGYPRNQSGDPTAQTRYSEAFAEKLESFAEVRFQDESLTSVMAEDRLKADGRPYGKADVDALAAAMILQDYMERHNG